MTPEQRAIIEEARAYYLNPANPLASRALMARVCSVAWELDSEERYAAEERLAVAEAGNEQRDYGKLIEDARG